MNKKLLIINIILVVAFALAACSPQATPTQEIVPTDVPDVEETEEPVVEEVIEPTDEPVVEEVVEEEPVTIQVWVYDSFAGDESAPIYAAVEKFQETYPYITVELIPTPSGSGPFRDAYIAAAQGGGGPDALIVDIIWSPQLAAAELALNLDEYASEDIKAFYPGPVETVMYDGSVYGIPWYTGALAMFYNKTAFEAAGLPIPTNDWTWEDFDTAVTTLTKDDMYGFGLMAGYGGSYEWFPWLWANGGEVLNEDLSAAAFTSPEGMESIEYFLGLITDKKVVPEAAKSWKSWDELHAAFVSQTIAMYEVGDWGFAAVDGMAPDFEWGVVALPKDERQASVVGGANWIINPNSKNPDAAYKWVQFITGPEVFGLMDGYKRLAARSGGDQQIVKDDPRMQVIVDSLGFSRARPAIPNWTTVDYDCIQPAFLKVYLEGVDIPTAMEEAEACTNQVLAEE